MKTIYLRTNLVNGKQYVGQTKDWKQRERDWRCLKKYKYANKNLSEDRAKYKLSDWKTEVLKVCNDENGDYWEQHYIKELNTLHPNGYNMSKGGKGPTGCIHSKEQNEQHSKRLKGRHLSPLTEFKKGCKSPKGMLGKHPSDETKKKMSESNKNKKKVYQYTIDCKLVTEYPSLMEAERQTGVHHQNIRACCIGLIKQTKGYKWSYIPL